MQRELSEYLAVVYLEQYRGYFIYRSSKGEFAGVHVDYCSFVEGAGLVGWHMCLLVMFRGNILMRLDGVEASLTGFKSKLDAVMYEKWPDMKFFK